MNDITIKDAVGEMRRQIAEAQKAADQGDIAFEILEAELQIQGSFSRSTEGGGSGKVSFSVFGIGAEAGAEGSTSRARETTQTVTLKLDVRRRGSGERIDISDEVTGHFGS